MALVAAVLAALAAASMAMIMMTMAASANRSAESRRHETRAAFLAEGAVESARVMIREALTNLDDPPESGTVMLGTSSVDYTITQVGPLDVTTDESGLQSFVRTYQIDATAVEGQHRKTAHRLIEAQQVPIFQFALFYENDMELWPGPEMTIAGRIFCNADIYLGCNRSLTVNTNYMHAAGRLYNRRKHNSDVNDRPVNIRRWVADPWDGSEPVEYWPLLHQGDFDALGISTTSGFDSDFAGHDANGNGSFFDAGDWLPFSLEAMERWSEPDFYSDGTGTTLMTGEMGTTSHTIPPVLSIAMFDEDPDNGNYEWNAASDRYIEVPAGTGTHAQGPYHRDADLSIITHTDGSWEAFDGDGFDVSGDLAAAGAISQVETYDARQAEGSGDSIDVTVIDLAAITAAGYFPSNGLLYTAGYGVGTGTDVAGFQITNGAELAGPLTVVSESSLFVHGDFNVVSKQPASVIADAVNLLSNAWDNSKTPGVIPLAAETTYNMAIVTGNIPSREGVYNGGVENLPRFHENWKDLNCNLNGSIACTWFSKYATSDHSGVSDLRNPPRRNWDYDPDFNDFSNLPPFTPTTTTIRDVVRW